MCYTHCQECDCFLWSYHARDKGLCPSCEYPDIEDYDCLEDRLAVALEISDNTN